jgi:hypothetical protein
MWICGFPGLKSETRGTQVYGPITKSTSHGIRTFLARSNGSGITLVMPG